MQVLKGSKALFRLEIDRYIGLRIFFQIFKHFTIIGYRFKKNKNPKPKKIQTFLLLLVTYTIIQSITSSEMCSLSIQTVSPNPILSISGWYLIWITDCPHSISKLFISDLCVHKHSFVFTECAFVSILMILHCYAYAKYNSNSNTVCNTDVVTC